jgi:hypothetical protein
MCISNKVLLAVQVEAVAVASIVLALAVTELLV